MTQPKPRVVGPPLPRWAAIVGSLFIVYHLGSIVLNALSATSGPWPGMEGPEMSLPPQLAALAHQKLALKYLTAIKQTHNYHFRSNRVGMPEAYLQIELYDKDNSVIKKLRFPDPNAPSAVQRRQESVVRWLIDDQPVERKMVEPVAAPDGSLPKISVWENPQGERRKLVITQVEEHNISRDQPTFRPTPWSLLVVRSLVRGLCRQYDAESAEVVRLSREPVSYRVLMERDPQLEKDELHSSYGRLPK